MTSRYNSQDERLQKLEHSVLALNTAIQGSHSMFLGLQPECKWMDSVVSQLESTLSRLRQEVETLSRRVKAVLSSVEERMREFEIWITIRL